jgi:hypothetical protein
MTKKRAIVTLAIGTKYVKMFDEICRAGWEDYAGRFGYDVIVIKEPLDTSERAMARSPAWQKLLILSQPWSADYERIVWIDSDILINTAAAGDVAAGVPVERVGAVETWSIPDREVHAIALRRQYADWQRNGVSFIDNLTPGAYYVNRGIPGGDLNDVVQTGVMVCSPRHHRTLFEQVYRDYEERGGAEWNYEMPALSYELLQADCVTWISPRFNYCVSNVMAAFYPHLLQARSSLAQRIWQRLSVALGRPSAPKAQLQALEAIYHASAFTHFAGCSGLMAPLQVSLQRSVSRSPRARSGPGANPPSRTGFRSLSSA